MNLIKGTFFRVGKISGIKCYGVRPPGIKCKGV